MDLSYVTVIFIVSRGYESTTHQAMVTSFAPWTVDSEYGASVFLRLVYLFLRSYGLILQ